LSIVVDDNDEDRWRKWVEEESNNNKYIFLFYLIFVFFSLNLEKEEIRWFGKMKREEKEEGGREGSRVTWKEKLKEKKKRERGGGGDKVFVLKTNVIWKDKSTHH